MSSENYNLLKKEELLKLAELGISEAQEEYGYRLLLESNVDNTKLKEAANWFSLSAEQGNARGMFNLATMYKMGQGVEFDYIKAFELYKKSSDLGLSVAKYFLSEMYKYGLGVEKDEEKALSLVAESFNNNLLVVS